MQFTIGLYYLYSFVLAQEQPHAPYFYLTASVFPSSPLSYIEGWNLTALNAAEGTTKAIFKERPGLTFYARGARFLTDDLIATSPFVRSCLWVLPGPTGDGWDRDVCVSVSTCGEADFDITRDNFVKYGWGNDSGTFYACNTTTWDHRNMIEIGYHKDGDESLMPGRICSDLSLKANCVDGTPHEGQRDSWCQP